MTRIEIEFDEPEITETIIETLVECGKFRRLIKWHDTNRYTVHAPGHTAETKPVPYEWAIGIACEAVRYEAAERLAQAHAVLAIRDLHPRREEMGA